MTLFNKKEKEASETNQSKETLGARIAFFRKNKNYTQEEFSLLLDVTPQAVSKWENDLSCPDILLLPKIAELFETTVDELLTGRKSYSSFNPNNEIDTSNLKLHIQISNADKKPVNINVPFSLVKRIAKIGNNISGILGTQALNNNQLDQILKLVDKGVTGEILNLVDENGQTIVIEIS